MAPEPMQEDQSSTTSGSLEEPDVFDIKGPIAINFATTSFTGTPRFSYKDAELELSFEGDQITITATPIGLLATVTLEDAVDAFVRTFTLVVPKITLANTGDQVEFDATGIELIDRSGAFVPAPGPLGVLQVSRLHQLHGTAQLIIF